MSQTPEHGRPWLRLLICLTFLAPGLVTGSSAQSANPCSSSIVPPSPPATTIVFPLSEVRRGLCGTAYTVFEGVNPEPMQVEILGLLKNSRGPGQDMILARLHGLKPEYTGVVAGMSGSPVYVEGKLLGALSFRIGQFSKEPIAGITPIAEMLAVRDGATTVAAGTEKAATTPTLGGASATPIETPLVFSGFSQEAIDRFGDRFRALGLSPVMGLGSSASDLPQPEPIVPGSAVSAVLIRGDLSMAGTCTVSYVDKSSLLACGHPITQFGHISFPMTKATVLATLPSPLNAFKIITTTETVGQFTEDRNAAIEGRFGETAHMIPVEIEITGDPAAEGGAAPKKTVQFEVADNKELTPSLMLVSIFQSLQQNNLASAEASYRLSGELTLEGERPVQLDALVSPNELNPAAINAALYVNERFSRLYGNATTKPVISGLHLTLSSVGPTRSATLEGVRLSRNDVRPGDSIDLEATLRPVRSSPVILRLSVRIPPGTAPGDLRLVVGDSATADRMSLPNSVQGQNISLADAVTQLNRTHANHRVYVTLLTHDVQTSLEGGTIGMVPLSLANVYESQRSEQKIQLNGESVEELGSVEGGFAISGSQVLTLKVK
ncbi:hypothetical protein HDF16_004438 [Granulicella aggregans]|uniref:Peptidase S55 domain-containing protein n=1 Tax=Granulicella aggregans TaxID=474949 RepID=A0A7W7ZGW8_9BACT|nr:SpoIVB peptidase S55 domain-containing protein [Granulicella aggregans]MBB5059709.1 hypothetical protein [Granulicella aggregans]